ncbi:hypothetical protein NHQ30_011014 [Ciborinia camelliae]|nr:hypothetical protein NHQ30_011014 [Ciborinia camelliae]
MTGPTRPSTYQINYRSLTNSSQIHSVGSQNDHPREIEAVERAITMRHLILLQIFALVLIAVAAPIRVQFTEHAYISPPSTLKVDSRGNDFPNGLESKDTNRKKPTIHAVRLTGLIICRGVNYLEKVWRRSDIHGRKNCFELLANDDNYGTSNPNKLFYYNTAEQVTEYHLDEIKEILEKGQKGPMENKNDQHVVELEEVYGQYPAKKYVDQHPEVESTRKEKNPSQHQPENNGQKLLADEKIDTKKEPSTAGFSQGVQGDKMKERPVLVDSEKMPIDGREFCLISVGSSSSFARLSDRTGNLSKLLACNASRLWADLKHYVGSFLAKIQGNSEIGNVSSKQTLKTKRHSMKDREEYEAENEELMRGEQVETEAEAELLSGKTKPDNVMKVLIDDQMTSEPVSHMEKVYRRAPEEGKKMPGRPVQFDPHGNYIDGDVLDSIMGVWAREIGHGWVLKKSKKSKKSGES